MTAIQSNVAELPKSWAWSKLGDILSNNGKSIIPNKNPDELFELYSVPTYDCGLPEVVLGRQIGSNKQIVKKDAVLLCKINPRINRVWIVGDYSPHQKIASTEWIPFFKRDGIDPKFLCYFMKNDYFRDFLSSNASGVGGSLMRIKAATFSDYPIPIAPPSEQHRIVAKIEELFSRLDAGVKGLNKVRAQLRHYRQTVLKAAVEGRLTVEWRKTHLDVEPAEKLFERMNQKRQIYERKRSKEIILPDFSSLPELPSNWTWATVDQLGPPDRTCTYGVLQPGPDVENGIPLIRVGDIENGKIRNDNLKKIDPRIAIEYERTKLKGGEVLITLVGAIGRTAVVPNSLIGANTARAVGVIPLNEELEAAWVEIWFRNPDKINEMTSKAHEVARKTLNLEDVRSAPVAIPPLAEQGIIINEIESKLSIAENAEEVINQSQKMSEKLRQSILKRAFEGKLVRQDPNDEPAFVLLERIKAERSRQEFSIRRRRSLSQ